MAESTAPYQPNVQAPAQVRNDFPPTVHILKTIDHAFQEVWDGRKRAELRNAADRNFTEGDLLMLREGYVERDGDEDESDDVWVYTGRYVVAEITHIIRCAYWMGDAGGRYQVLSFKVLSQSERGPKTDGPF